MREENARKLRRLEVVTGLIIILVAFSYVASLLLDFNFVSPYATLQEDLSYLSEQIESQRVSAYAWLISATFTLVALPFFLAVFLGRLRALHYFNGLFLVGASLAFIMMWKLEMDLYRFIVMMLDNGIEQAGDEEKTALLQLVGRIKFYRLAGSSCFGLFAVGLGLSGFRIGRFPLFSTGLLFLSGPVLIFFNWYDPDHVVRTAALAGIMIGVVVFCVRLINKGLTPVGKSESADDLNAE